jgi:RNA polymerase sigma-70 factor (ECF subfamily)
LSRLAEARVDRGVEGAGSVTDETSRERALVGRLREGDRRAFDAIYDAHRARVFGFLLRLSGRRDVAEDLLQETFLRLAKHAARLDPDTRIRPWLFTVARNAFVSHRRAAMLDLSRLGELALWPRTEAAADTPLDVAEATEKERALEAALQNMPLKYREAILCVAVEGLSPSEAAEVLGLAPDALRQRLSRARAMIREHLEGRGAR